MARQIHSHGVCTKKGVKLVVTMNKYIKLDLESLIEMLIARIRDYDRMLSTRVFSEEEFARCKHTLAELHAAIKEKAKLQGFNTDNIFPNFPPPEGRHIPGDRSKSRQVRKRAGRKR